MWVRKRGRILQSCASLQVIASRFQSCWPWVQRHEIWIASEVVLTQYSHYVYQLLLEGRWKETYNPLHYPIANFNVPHVCTRYRFLTLVIYIQFISNPLSFQTRSIRSVQQTKKTKRFLLEPWVSKINSTASCTGFSGCNSSRSHEALKSRLKSLGICPGSQKSQQIWGGSNPMKKHWLSWVNHGFVTGC